ncbi:MAG TPA: ABC transporter ATP-binding protein [Syntrophomonadaceae bacterium]|nr:ABC transporter ATP-binding protein [Syntrophomonadaceae bacterium]
MNLAESPAIKAINLGKAYGTVKAVNDINFLISRGEIFGLLGPNGAGKTTTVEMLVGLRMRDCGCIEVLGMDPQKYPRQVKTKIGVQLQTANLYPRLTVKEIVRLFASFFREPLPVEQVIEQVGLQEKANSQVKTLSGGQMQRLALATAIVNNGDLIFLDEPTTGLDPQARRGLWDIILELQNAGKTVFLTTHYMDEAERLCDRVAIIDYGSIIAIGSPRELIASNFKEKALEFYQPLLANCDGLNKTIGVTRMQVEENMITLYTTEAAQTIAGLMKVAAAKNIAVDDITVRGASLEDVFLKYTGRRLRE